MESLFLAWLASLNIVKSCIGRDGFRDDPNYRSYKLQLLKDDENSGTPLRNIMIYENTTLS